jgi:hypothetical protein
MTTFNEHMRNRLADSLIIGAAPTIAYGTGLLKGVKTLADTVGGDISELQLAAGTLDLSSGAYFGLTGKPRMALAGYLISLLPELQYTALGSDYEQGLRNLAAKTAAFAVSYGIGTLIKRKWL